MIDTPQALPIGTRLGDGERYEIRQRIGIGGMAEVYKAADTRLGNRIVAIKTLSASVAQHQFAARMRSLFIQEAQALSRVKDENVVDVLDFGTAADGTPYMVMEFLNGTDLGVFLKKNKQVTIEQAVDIMLGVCAGVHACHLAGIIHRDLKPANIFLTRTLKGEQTKVLDFSVAKVPIARSTPTVDQAKTDLIVGTPTYMSPEQALGRPANELSDQYSIGGLLYRCLTGRPPQGVLPRPRELRPEIPERLEAVILRALENQPDKRFATVHDLGHGLLPFASSSGRGRWRPYYLTPPLPVDPTTTGTLPRLPTPARRRDWRRRTGVGSVGAGHRGRPVRLQGARTHDQPRSRRPGPQGAGGRELSQVDRGRQGGFVRGSVHRGLGSTHFGRRADLRSAPCLRR